jgi:predicted dehydrogenase
MDYTKSSKWFQVQKALRYTQMYGVRRTMVKVRGQFHMKRVYKDIPAASPQLQPRQTVGLIGCGNYAFSNIAFYLDKTFGGVIGACMDVDANRAASLAAAYKVPLHTTRAEDVLAHPNIRMVYVASNHASHAEYAIKALDHEKSVYIEKPHVVTEDQLRRLAAAAARSSGRVYLGFNRPGSTFGRLILEHLARERGSGMYNWFVAGHAIDPDHWYFKPEEGGRILGNLCHWTDFVLRLAGDSAFPVEIRPTRATKADSDIVVTYTFPDDTVAVISFSAKGHTFEGVAESLHAQRGNCLIAMHDYKDMTIEIVEHKKRFRNRLRDHGHATNITYGYRSVHDNMAYDRSASIQYMCDTAWLFLETKRALEQNTALVVNRYELPRS